MVNRFQPEFMEVEFVSSSMACVYSPDENTVAVTGHFRTNSDYIAFLFNSKDGRMHEDARYPENSNFSGVRLSFRPSYSGNVAHFDNHTQKPAMVVRYKNGSEKYCTMAFMSNKDFGSDSIASFTGMAGLSHDWIEWDSETVWWGMDVIVGYKDIFDENGNYIETVPVTEWQEGYGSRGADYALDYENGAIYPVVGSGIPYGAQVEISYRYNAQQTYIIDFDHLVQGTHPDNSSQVSPLNIARISFSIVPTYFVQNSYRLTGRSDEFTIVFNDWTVSGGGLGEFPAAHSEHPYRVAEGYDDEYYRNPRRIVQAMYHLGYRKIINLYVGASHYYDKSGEAGENGLDYTKIYLIPENGVCTAAKTWFRYLLKAMREFGFTDIIVSISIENLQLPEAWKQRMYNGEAGRTGWEPPTSFFSLTNTEARQYWESIARTYLDICVEEGFAPILQLGEPWWWKQDFVPGDVSTPYPGAPPCFYDDATKAKYLHDKGKELPVFTTSDIELTDENIEALAWLRDELGRFSDFAKSIVKSYEGGQYTILFFPPSVIDPQTTPPPMKIVNFPKNYWVLPNLDFLQIEDYDWVVLDNEHHLEVYDFPWKELRYQPHRVHYFAGFAWEQYNIDIDTQWERIETAAVKGLSFGIKHVFIWAGTQIRRDSWNPDMPVRYIPNIQNWALVNVEELEIEETE
jgi:hypothetical protein